MSTTTDPRAATIDTAILIGDGLTPSRSFVTNYHGSLTIKFWEARENFVSRPAKALATRSRRERFDERLARASVVAAPILLLLGIIAMAIGFARVPAEALRRVFLQF